MSSVRLTIYADDINFVIQSYDVARIKRSTSGEGGPYELITADTPTAALLLSDAGPFNVVGKTLTVTLDSNDSVDVVFTGTDPLDAAAVATQIDTAIGEAIATEPAGTGKLQLESNITGTESLLKVEGDAATEFGWTDGQQDTGEEAHISLISGQNLYDLVDDNGASNYYYKSQYYNTANQLESLDSEPFVGEPGTLVGESNLSVGSIDLVDASGIAVPDQDISFYSVHEPLQVEGLQVAFVRGPITVTTSPTGHAEVTLVRGLKMKVVFEGTNIIREITVPDAPTFDVLVLVSAAPDPYSVAAHTFPSAIRRTV